MALTFAPAEISRKDKRSFFFPEPASSFSSETHERRRMKMTHKPHFRTITAKVLELSSVLVIKDVAREVTNGSQETLCEEHR